MKVTRDAVVEMFQSIGFKTADQWSAKKIQVKVNNLQEFLADTKLPEEIMDDKNHLLNRIAKALDADQKVEVEGAEELAESRTSGKPVVTVHTAKKTKKAKKHETETEDEETDVKKDKKAVKAAKTEKVNKVVKEKKAEKAPKEKRITAISIIVGLLKRGSITKEALLEHLGVQFPDRKSDSVMSTINTLVPSDLRKAGYNVVKTDKGYKIK